MNKQPLRDVNPPGVARRYAIGLAALLAANAAIAQPTAPTANAPAPSAPAPDQIERGAPNAPAETIELSPFLVSAESETGYLATRTLAGTRISSDIRDIGSSISVYTKDLVDDLGITNLSDILVYGTSTEVGGVTGNFSGNSDTNAQVTGDNVRTEPQGSSRTRGLSGPNNMRNLFNTSIPGDAYISESVTVNRGPNAVLFGVGSPAGVIDTTLSQADLRKSSTKVEFRTDQNGSLRASVNTNQVILPRRLALRFAALDDLEKFNQKPAFEHKERVYGAATYKPLERTTLRVNFESGRSKANRPITVLPFNSISEQWQALPDSQKTFNWRFYDDPALNPNASTQVGNSVVYHPTYGQAQIFNQIALVYDDPTQNLPSRAFKTEIGGGNGLNQIRNPIFHPVFNRDQASDAIQFLATRNVGELPAVAFPGGVLPGLVQFETFDSFAAFDWADEMLDASSRQTYKFNNLNATIEQLFLDNRAGIELAYNREKYSGRNRNSFFQQGNNNHIRIDVNQTLPNGEPNPNLGRPYAQYGGGNWSDPETDRENFRATGFFRHDFAANNDGWMKWLGRHTLTGLYEEYTVESLSNNSRLATYGPAAEAVAAGNPSSFNRRPTLLVYMGDSVLNGQPLRLRPIDITPIDEGLSVDTFYFANNSTTPSVQGNGAVVPTTLGLIGETVNYNINLIKSQAAVLQSHFLRDHLVTTVGWRKDESFRNRVSIPWNVNTSPKVLYDIDEFDISRGALPKEDGDEIISYSGVLRWPQSIVRLPGGLEMSVFANKSENFTPSGGRTDVFGNLLGSPKGETTEFGINLWALNDRLFIRANRFKTKVVGQGISASTGPYATAYGNATYQIAQFWLSSMNTNPQINRFADIDLLFSALPPGTRELWGFIPTGTLAEGNLSVPNGIFPVTRSDTTDFEAEGTEIEVTYSPNRQWRITFNVAEQETVQTNIAAEGRAYIERMLPVWQQLGGKPRNAYPTGWDPSRPDSELPATTQTLWQWLNTADGPLPGYYAWLASEGRTSTEQRKWRANAVVNYTFTNDSKLKGWNVGGSVRWQDKVNLGYPSSLENGAIVYDIENPYYGDDETNIDMFVGYRRKILSNKVEWRVQLNARNVVNLGDDLIAARVQYDGSGAVYRTAPEQRYILTSSFTF